MADLGDLNYFLGISVQCNTKGMFLSQKKYTLDILDRAQMQSCNPCHTLADTHAKLDSSGTPVADPMLFRSNVGALQYLTFTRPNIAFAVRGGRRIS